MLLQLSGYYSRRVITRVEVNTVLFSIGQQGALYDPSDSTTVFQERTGAAATTPAGADDPVGTILDVSGNANHATALSDATRPILKTDGPLWWLQFDGVDDHLISNGLAGIVSGTDRPVSNFFAAEVAVKASGQIVYGWTRTSTNIPLLEMFYGNFLKPNQKRDDAGLLKATDASTITGKNVVSVIDNGFIADMRINGVLDSSLDRDVGLITVDLFTLGASRRAGVHTLPAECKIYGFSVVDQAISGNAFGIVEQWLAQKSGITL